MATVRALPSGNWQVQVRLKGFKPAQAVFPTKREAQVWGAETETALRKGAYLAPSDLLFGEVLDRYLDTVSATKKRPNTHNGNVIKAKKVREHLGQYALKNITPAVISAYSEKRLTEVTRKGTPPSSNTLRLELLLISAVFNRCVREWHLCTSNPVLFVDKPKCVARDRLLTEEEEGRLWRALEAQDARARQFKGRLIHFVTVALFTGMRAGEISTLRKNQIDFRNSTLTLYETKNGKPRIVYLTKDVCLILKKLIDIYCINTDLIFWTLSKKGQYVPFDYTSSWRRVLAKANIQDFKFHDLRHEFVSRLFSKTDLSDGNIALLTGHLTPASLWGYKHKRTDERLRKAVTEVSAYTTKNKGYAYQLALLQEQAKALNIEVSPELLKQLQKAFGVEQDDHAFTLGDFISFKKSD